MTSSTPHTTLDISGAKSDRSMSPSTGMTEDERRDLISRQHRALYGNDSNMYSGEGAGSRAMPSQDARVTAGNVPGAFRGTSASPYDAFALQSGGPGAESAIGQPPRDSKPFPSAERDNSNASPNNASPLNAFENQQQQAARTSNSSPVDSPPRDGSKPPSSVAGGVAPIGTRPNQQQGQGAPQPGNLQKRSTTPLPSPLSYGFSAEQGQADKQGPTPEDKNTRGAWGASGVWGAKGGLGTQAKVWG